MRTNRKARVLRAIILFVTVCHGWVLPRNASAQQAEQAASETQTWFGILDAEIREFRFVLELKRNGDEPWTGKLLSLDEGNREFPLDNLIVTADAFGFEIKSSSGSYQGSLAADGKRVSGQWKQRGSGLDLSFEKVDAIPKQKLKALWTGQLNVLIQKLDVAFRELASGDIYFDSITQKAGGFVATKTEEGDQVVIEVPGIKGTFTGKYNADQTELSGTWSQGILPLELTLVKSTTGEIEISPVNRPQTPRPPFPYESVEVLVTNEQAAGVKLAGTLTMPEGDSVVPAVVLISGSGPQDRDETIVDHKPFAVIADYLSRHGIAVLRFDDRGVGGSQGDFSEATSEDFASDVAAIVKFLRSQPRVNPQQIGLCGHSEGGIIAPMVAAQDPAIAFVILLAGTGVNGEEILVNQAGLILQASGVEAAEVERQGKMQRIFIELAKQEPPLAEAEFIAAATKKIDPFLTTEERGDEQTQQMIAAAAAQILNPWFRFFLTYEPSTNLSQLTCPVLAINGEKDLQVDPNLNLPAIESALTKAKLENFELRKLPGLNHLFQTCKTGNIDEYQEIEETINPQVLELLSTWIHEQLD